MGVLQYEAGTEVLIQAKILDQRQTPPVLFDPDEVRILLARPDGSIAVNYALMTVTAVPGIYQYAYQTIISDMAGIWTVQIKTLEGSSVVIRSSVAAFELLSTVPPGAVVTQGINPAPVGATYITQTPDSTLTAEQALSALATGILIVTTTTGVLTSLAHGTADQVLRIPGAGGAPAYGAVDLTKAAAVTGALPTSKGGTNSALGDAIVMVFRGEAVPSNATSYVGRDDSATEADISLVCPVTGTIIARGVHTTAGPGGSDTFTYRNFINGAAGAGNTVLTGAAVTAFSTGLTDAVTEGQTISVRVIASATAAVTNHGVTLLIRATGPGS